MSVFPPGIMMIVEKENERKIKKEDKMEMTLAILMGIGIFVGIPMVVGLTVTGGYMAATHKEYQAKAKVEKAVGTGKVTA
jgi:O-antigen/teichoic acid export membrane protein